VRNSLKNKMKIVVEDFYLMQEPIELLMVHLTQLLPNRRKLSLANFIQK